MNRKSVQPARVWRRYYDIVILPPAPVRDLAIELSRQLYRLGGQWNLGRRHFLPHISLYHIPVADRNLAPFLEAVQKVADSTSWGELETAGFDMPVLKVTKPEWLRILQRRVVHQTVEYFNRDYGAEDLWSLHRFSGRRLDDARRYLHEYGTPLMGLNFRPHLTLSSFKGPEPTGLKLSVPRIRFRVDRIQVCELGPSHSCQKLIWGRPPK